MLWHVAMCGQNPFVGGFVVGDLNVCRGLLAACAAAWWRRGGGGADGCQGLARGESVGARAGARECVPFCDTLSLE
jgi:hypothetical protein